MKNLITIFIFVCSSIFVFAQEDLSNDRFVGGSINFLQSQNNYGRFGITASGLVNINSSITRQTLLGLRPYIGTQLSNSWSLGVRFEYLYGYGLYEDAIISTSVSGIIRKDLEQISHGFGLGVFGRYKVFADKKLSPFIQPQINARQYQSSTKHAEEVVDRQRIRTTDFGASFGILYNYEEHLRILLHIGAVSAEFGTTTDVDDNISTAISNFSTEFRPVYYSFGIEWRF